MLSALAQNGWALGRCGGSFGGAIAGQKSTHSPSLIGTTRLGRINGTAMLLARVIAD
jgi:hypothetical protein